MDNPVRIQYHYTKIECINIKLNKLIDIEVQKQNMGMPFKHHRFVDYDKVHNIKKKMSRAVENVTILCNVISSENIGDT